MSSWCTRASCRRRHQIIGFVLPRRGSALETYSHLLGDCQQISPESTQSCLEKYFVNLKPANGRSLALSFDLAKYLVIRACRRTWH